MQLCDTPRMVTVSIDKCNFEKPAKENQLLKMLRTVQWLKHTKIYNQFNYKELPKLIISFG
jgi:acyl-CoA hydrolase